MSEQAKRRRATYHLYTFTVSKLIAAFGSSIYAFGVSLYVLAMTGSAANFAINLICNILPKTLLAPIAGYVADRYPKKPVIILSQAASILSIAGLLLYSVTAGLSLPAIYITTALVAASSLFTSVTFSSSVANLVDGERIQKATAVNQSAVSAAAIGGPVIGGMLFGFVSMQLFLLIQLIAYAAALVLESTMNFRLYTARKPEEESEEKMKFLASFKEGIAYMKTNRVISVLVTAVSGINFFFSAMLVGLPYVVVEELKITSAHFGIIEGMLAAGMLAGSVYFSLRKEVRFPLLFSKRGIIVLSVLLMGVGLPLVFRLSYGTNFTYFIILMLLFGIAVVSVNTPIGVMMQKDVEEAYRGRIFGIVEAMSMAMMPLGMLLFGLLYDALPAQYVLWGSGFCLLLLTLYVFRSSLLVLAYPALKPSDRGPLFAENEEKLVK